jgi:hypothetical protein
VRMILKEDRNRVENKPIVLSAIKMKYIVLS